jgi:transcription initiation factor TFIIB
VDSPQKFIPKLASVMGVPREVERLAMDMLEAVNRTSAVTGKDPRGVAAAALYYAAEIADKRVIQRKMAKASDTTEVTLRNRYRELKRVLGGRFASLY